MFIAKVTFVQPVEGSPGWHPQSGYHPQIDAGGEYTSCVIESLGDATVFAFDQEYVVRLRLLFPDLYASAFSVGSVVRLYEGSRRVGTGVIIEVMR